ncbi:MAG: hypothetical protein Q4G35_02475 [Propionibacteriaceae bacterium]|nr:hypothetical protein [Propionibacteriaceae bacterium]
MARIALTRTEARRRARERSAAILARETQLVGLVADWELAHDALNRCFRALYDAGLTRGQIAERTGLSTGRVPRHDELLNNQGVNAQEGPVEATDVSSDGDDADATSDTADIGH